MSTPTHTHTPGPFSRRLTPYERQELRASRAPKLAEALHALVNAIYREYPEKVPFYCRTEVESAMDTLTEWDAP